MKKYNSNEPLAKWLDSINWSLWTTMSTDYTMTLRSARRLISRMFQRVAKKYKNVKVFWAAEEFDLKDGYHLHALWFINDLEWLDSKSYKEFVNDWRVVSKCDKAVIYSEPYEKGKGAHSYITKYINRPLTCYDLFSSDSKEKDYILDNIPTIKELKSRAKAKRILEEYCNKKNTTIKDLQNNFNKINNEKKE